MIYYKIYYKLVFFYHKFGIVKKNTSQHQVKKILKVFIKILVGNKVISQSMKLKKKSGAFFYIFFILLLIWINKYI